MYVAWESPEHITQAYPVVLVHGGTLQGTEWLDTPDGRPGWAQRFLEAGFVVFRVDRPGHGRSPYHPDIMGPMGPAFSYERAREVYFPEGGGETQWPFESDDEAAFLTPSLQLTAPCRLTLRPRRPWTRIDWPNCSTESVRPSSLDSEIVRDSSSQLKPYYKVQNPKPPRLAANRSRDVCQ